MDINKFELIVEEHSLCAGSRLYNAVALAGEVGEALNMIKKREMAVMRPDWVRQNENTLPSAVDFENRTIDELGDVLFYLTRVAHDSGVSLGQLMDYQATKLSSKSKEYGRTFLK